MRDINATATGPQKCFQTIASIGQGLALGVKLQHPCVFAYHSLIEKQLSLLAEARIRTVRGFRHSLVQNGAQLPGSQRFDSNVS